MVSPSNHIYAGIHAIILKLTFDIDARQVRITDIILLLAVVEHVGFDLAGFCVEIESQRIRRKSAERLDLTLLHYLAVLADDINLEKSSGFENTEIYTVRHQLSATIPIKHIIQSQARPKSFSQLATRIHMMSHQGAQKPRH